VSNIKREEGGGGMEGGGGRDRREEGENRTDIKYPRRRDSGKLLRSSAKTHKFILLPYLC
jgi:hypothetical protein